MQAYRYGERAYTADWKECPGDGGVEDWLYTLPTKMPLHPFGGNKLVDQTAQEESYRQVGQYLNEIVLECDEKLDYQLLFTPGVLKLWLVEEPLCLST